MDFSAGHCPAALITLNYNLNLNTPLLTQGQCSWGNPSNVTQDDILMSSKCQYFKILLFFTLTMIRLCRKKKKSSQMSHKYHISQGMETNHKLFSNCCRSLFFPKAATQLKILVTLEQGPRQVCDISCWKKDCLGGLSDDAIPNVSLESVCNKIMEKHAPMPFLYLDFWGDDLARDQNILQNFRCVYWI